MLCNRVRQALPRGPHAAPEVTIARQKVMNRSLCFLLCAGRNDLLGCAPETITGPRNFECVFRSDSPNLAAC